MSIENIDILVNKLLAVKKQMQDGMQLNAIESDILKKDLLSFYEQLLTPQITPSQTMEKTAETDSSAPLPEAISNTVLTDTKQMMLTNPPLAEVHKVHVEINAAPAEEKENLQFIESIAAVDPAPAVVEAVHTDFSAPIEKTTQVIESNNDTSVKSPASLNERFQSSTNLAEKFATGPKSMAELIDLNKRLLFVDVLFNGNSQLFNQVLQHIDAYKTSDEAMQFLQVNKQKLNINEKKETVFQSFLEVINKKYL